MSGPTAGSTSPWPTTSCASSRATRPAWTGARRGRRSARATPSGPCPLVQHRPRGVVRGAARANLVVGDGPGPGGPELLVRPLRRAGLPVDPALPRPAPPALGAGDDRRDRVHARRRNRRAIPHLG